MLFPTVEFALFFVVVLTASWLLMPYRGAWRALVLVASYVFYGWWDPRFVLLLAGCTLVNHFAALAISRTDSQPWRRAILGAALVADLGVLAWFKYYGFFVTSLANLLGSLGMAPNLPLLEIVLPVGISFFTFQAISYVVDVHRRDTPAVALSTFAVYLSFFPHLVAGPIVRAREFVPQLARRRDPRHVDASRAFWLIAGGLFKKVVVSSLVATALVDRVFAAPELFSAPVVLLAVYGYAVQIYADFSGYTDIAIGCALLMGFQFPQNFDQPYRALSLQDFWRRWHMTLSRWLRDYLYIPLGGNAGGERRTRRNLLLTMLLGGLWHGAAWTFVIWGGLHGVGLAVERARARRRHRPEPAAVAEGPGTPPAASAPGGAQVSAAVTLATSAPPAAERRRSASPLVRWLVTFHLVCLGWVFFRADSLATAGTLLGRLVTGWTAPSGLSEDTRLGWLLVAIGGSIAAQFLPRAPGRRLQAVFSRASVVVQAAALGAVLLVTDALGPEGIAPFIYFQF